MKNDITLVYDHKWPTDEIPTLRHCAVLAEILANNVGRSQPWREKYILNLVRGVQSPGPQLQKAIAIEANKIDDGHPWQTAREITVLSPNGVEPGSVITGHTVYCPGCGVKFVPDYGHRRWCHICRPPRKRAT